MTLCNVIETFVVLSAVFPCPSVVEAQNVTSLSLFRHVIDFTFWPILESCQILSCQMSSGFLEQVAIKCCQV